MKISEIDLILKTKSEWERLREELRYMKEPGNVLKIEMGGRAIRPSHEMRVVLWKHLEGEIIARQTELQMFGVHDFEGKAIGS